MFKLIIDARDLQAFSISPGLWGRGGNQQANMEQAIKSLVWATDVDVLGPDHTVARRDGYWAVHSPSNPTYWWGNLLLFDDAPGPGDGERWARLFAAEFARRPEVSHCTLAWDRTDGAAGDAEAELVARGFELERSAGLIATPERLRAHPRASRDCEVRALSPLPGRDEELWEQVIALQLSQDAGENDERYHLQFLRARQRERRALFAAGGRGAWYVALLADTVVGSLGIVVTGARARYQTVDTAASHRRRGIASLLVYEAAQDALARQRIDHLVIVADPDYHAIGIYESLGFARAEQVVGALRKPPAAVGGCGQRLGTNL